MKILKDADALDRTRFRNNLELNRLRYGIAFDLVKTSYQIQEIRGKISLDEKLSIGVYSPKDVQKIKEYQVQGISDFIIERSYETYDIWGYGGKRLFSSPEEMINRWLYGR